MASYDSEGGYYNTPIPGMVAPVTGTGAPGSQGISADMSAPVLMDNVIVSVTGQSSQVEPDRATVSVGDTLSMSSDASVPRAGGDPMTGLGLSDIISTGAGSGTVVTPHHLSSGGGRG